MLRFLPYVLKTLWRHRWRTLLTFSGTAVALLIFSFVAAARDGWNQLGRQREANESLVVFQAHRFCPATSHLPQDYRREIERLAGVRQAIPIQVFTNNCRASLDVVVFYGLPPETLPAVRDFRLLAGNWSGFQERQDAALVGQAVAGRRAIRLGDRFSIGGVTVFVAGIYASGNRAEENYIYTHLDFLQRSHGQDRAGTVTQFEVLLDPAADRQEACQRIDAALRDRAVPTHTRPKGVFQAQSLGDLTQLIALANYVGLACVGLALLLVSTTNLMSVHDRRKEYAVLQTLGFSSSRVFLLVVLESVVLSVAGGGLGVAMAAAVLEWSRLSLGAEAVTIALRLSPPSALAGLGLSLAAGVLAAVAPAWQAARTDLVSALRLP